MIGLILIFGLATLAVTAASATEVAVFALPLPRLRDLEAEGAPGARHLNALRLRPASFLTSVWGLRIAGAALAVLSVWELLASLTRSISAQLIAAALAVLVVVIAEFAGKTLGHRATEAFSLRVSRPLWFLSRVLLVVTWPAEQVARVLAPTVQEILPGISDREIRDLVSPGNGEQIEEHERQLIERAFLLDQTTAYDIMTPRVEMVAWSESKTLTEVAPELRAVRYSRIPLYRDSVDKITGILYTRDAYQALISGLRNVQLSALAREPLFVPGSVTLDRLLLDFQTRRLHMGIVIDEYGGVDGLVALEDILEELVGEIVDESDVAKDPIVRLSRHEILVDAGADLREINHFFNTTFPQLEHRSLNGYLLDILGRVPEPGERIDAEGVQIEVTAASDTQILRARLTRVAPPRADAGTPDFLQAPNDTEERRAASRDEPGRDPSAGSAA